MYSAAKPENKSKVAGMMFSIAFTAFLTGITEPVEFTFMFLAPVLYAFHAVMTGIALAVANMFGILHGFGFSAGLIDYVLNYSRNTEHKDKVETSHEYTGSWVASEETI